MLSVEPLVRLEGASLVVGRQRFPVDRVQGAAAEEEPPSLRFPALGMIASLICIPILHALPLPDSGAVMAAFAAVGVLIFVSIFRLVFASETYAVVLSLVEGEKRIALRSGNHLLVVSVVAQVRELLRVPGA
jgi:hypothetical protein